MPFQLSTHVDILCNLKWECPVGHYLEVTTNRGSYNLRTFINYFDSDFREAPITKCIQSR